MKVLQVDDDLVLPFATDPHDHVFATLHEHQPRGRRARVVEAPDASPRGLARAELGIAPEAAPADAELAEHAAVVVLEDLAWLQDVPEGSEVRLSPTGRMKARVSADHLDWHRAETKAWAKHQRRAGYLPLLLVVGDRVRVVAIPWTATRRSVVDLDEVRARLPQYGVRSHTVNRLEVL